MPSGRPQCRSRHLWFREGEDNPIEFGTNELQSRRYFSSSFGAPGSKIDSVIVMGRIAFHRFGKLRVPVKPLKLEIA
jgi:hypothetical protein